MPCGGAPRLRVGGTAVSDGLGYGPRPHVLSWRGTPIPPVDRPLPAFGGLEGVAERTWRNGPPRTILRNGPWFLRHVMDHGRTPDVTVCERAVPADLWTQTLLEAKPGSMSRRARRWFRVKRGLFRIRDLPAWPPRTCTATGDGPARTACGCTSESRGGRAATHGLTPEEAVRTIIPPGTPVSRRGGRHRVPRHSKNYYVNSGAAPTAAFA